MVLDLMLDFLAYHFLFVCEFSLLVMCDRLSGPAVLLTIWRVLSSFPLNVI